MELSDYIGAADISRDPWLEAAPFLAGLLVLLAGVMCQGHVRSRLTKFLAEESEPTGTDGTKSVHLQAGTLDQRLNLEFDRIQVVTAVAAMLPGIVLLASRTPALGYLMVAVSTVGTLWWWIQLDNMTPGTYDKYSAKGVSYVTVVAFVLAVLGIVLAFLPQK